MDESQEPQPDEPEAPAAAAEAQDVAPAAPGDGDVATPGEGMSGPAEAGAGDPDGAPEAAVGEDAADDAAADADVLPDADADADVDAASGVLDSVQEFIANTWDAGLEIWFGGGWAMIALAIISTFIFAVGFGVWRRLRKTGIHGLEEARWRRWIHEPDAREGNVGRLFHQVDAVIGDGHSTVHDGFDEVRTTQAAPFARDLQLMKVAVGAAPLVGLLGTVTGMLATFRALGAGSGGDQTMGAIAEGISEALYTTEAGLIIALPGLFFHYFLSTRYKRFESFIAHAEAVWARDAIERKIALDEARWQERLKAIVHMELKRRVHARMGTASVGS